MTHLHSAAFSRLSDVEHIFLTRDLPGSSHVYTLADAKLIHACDPNSEVNKNVAVAMQNLGFVANRLCVLQQSHGTKVVFVDDNLPLKEHEADAQVTSTPGVALAIYTADCVPILFADTKRPIIGAAHAGWKGAFDGVVQSTVMQMKALGSNEGDIVAAIGPCIQWDSYEVGPKFYQRFVERSIENKKFFKPSLRTAYYLFDLPGMLTSVMREMGIKEVHDLGLDTFSNPKQFFSYRRQGQNEQRFQGNLLSVVMLQASI